MKVKEAFGKVMNFADDHQREIKLGLTIAGIVLTGITSAKAGIKANEIIKEQKKKFEELEDMDDEDVEDIKKDLTIESVKKLAPVVLPPVIIGGATIFSAVSGYSSASKQIAALSAAYNISEKALTEFQDKAKEMLGDGQVQKVKDAVNEDKVKSTPRTDIVNTGKGETLCLDEASGRYFYSKAEAIKNACNIINKRMMDEYYVSFNELYDELGLPPITLGDDLGFNIDSGLIDIEHVFTAILNENDEVVLVFNVDEYVSTKYMEHRNRLIR